MEKYMTNPREAHGWLARRIEDELPKMESYLGFADMVRMQEVYGILAGMDSGYIRHGQQRIADNLLAVCESLEARDNNHEPDHIRSVLSDWLYSASRFGLTTQGLAISGRSVGDQFLGLTR